MLRNIRRDERHGVDISPMLHLQLVQSPMHILHEVVEVYPRLRLDGARQGVMEQVHQHGLAAAHVSEEVQPPRQTGRYVANGILGRLARPEEGREDGLLDWLEEVEVRHHDGGGVVVAQLVVQMLETLDDT